MRAARAGEDQLMMSPPAIRSVWARSAIAGGAGQAIRGIYTLPLVTGDFRYPGGGAPSMTSGHHRVVVVAHHAVTN